ncbi:DUF4149 domain-containing protein [Thiomicrorhabdus sp. Kp2]|uniref:DUF4149 domain-containing protein n=1 Tax=Thiomicrorhabdus sp. Kp2 TaxID=1123518 RepID=UPI000403B09A|nr:DUF4149 domain-containing protein [Thiomicrorhabdus sp. Kp2]
MLTLPFYKRESFYFALSQFVFTFLATLFIVVGYLVTPVLFANLDSKGAGDIAGVLFVISGYISLFFLTLLLGWQFVLKLGLRFYWQNIFLLSILAILLWVISPWMSAIKQNYPMGLSKDSIDWPEFAALHGVYQVAYLLVIIVLIVAILKSAKSLKVLGEQR